VGEELAGPQAILPASLIGKGIPEELRSLSRGEELPAREQEPQVMWRERSGDQLQPIPEGDRGRVWALELDLASQIQEPERGEIGQPSHLGCGDVHGEAITGAVILNLRAGRSVFFK